MADEAPSTPSSSTPKSTPRGRGGPRLRGGVTRKSKAERDQFAQEELERQKARAAEHEAATRGTRGGRLVNRGVRGGASQVQRQASSAGGGVFGGGVTATQTKQKYESYAELLEGGVRETEPDAPSQDTGDAESTVKGKSSTRGGASKGGGKGGNTTGKDKDQLGEILTDDEPDDIPKRDIERIWISSSEDEDAVSSSVRKGKQKAVAASKRQSRAGVGLRPVRAPRTLREEEDQNAGNTSTARKRRAIASKKSNAEIQEVSSDDRDGTAMELDNETEAAQATKDAPSSPEQSKRQLKKPVTAPTTKPGRDTKASANETVEDRAERLRVQDDLEKLRGIFLPKRTLSLDDEDDENTALAGEVDESTSLEQGKFLLFQLPPLTPLLTDPTANPVIKTESTALPTTGNTSTTIDLDGIPDNPAPATNSISTSTETIKPDPDNKDPSSKDKQTLQTAGFLTAIEPTRLPAGIVGKLNVHKSGKVTVDWGGTDMEVKLGSEVDFLQDVVLLREGSKDEVGGTDGNMEDGVGQGGHGHGKAYALGHVRQKMVLIPDWAKLYD